MFFCTWQSKISLLFFSYSVGVHVLVEDVNEFAPKWKIRSNEKTSESEPVHTLATNVAIEEGQLLEEVRERCGVDTDQDFLCELGMKPHTIKSRAVDRSTIQFWTLLGQRSQHISIKFPLHKQSENTNRQSTACHFTVLKNLAFGY